MPTHGPSPATSHMGTSPCPKHTHTHTTAHTAAFRRALETMTRGPFLFKDSCQRMMAPIQHCSRFAQSSLIKRKKAKASTLSVLSLSFPPLSVCLRLTLSITLPLPPQFNTDLTASIILQRRLFADAAELSIRTDTQSGSNVTSPHYVNG